MSAFARFKEVWTHIMHEPDLRADPREWKLLLVNPLLGLAADWQVKAFLSVVIAAGMEIGKRLLGLYGELLAAEPMLVLLLVTLMVSDLTAGVFRAVRRKEALTSIAFRRTTWKVIEYAFIIGPCVAIGNAFGDQPIYGPIIGEFGTAALLWGCLTEWFSIVENITGSAARAKKIFKRIQDVLSGGRSGEINISDDERNG